MNIFPTNNFSIFATVSESAPVYKMLIVIAYL